MRLIDEVLFPTDLGPEGSTSYKICDGSEVGGQKPDGSCAQLASKRGSESTLFCTKNRTHSNLKRRKSRTVKA